MPQYKAKSAEHSAVEILTAVLRESGHVIISQQQDYTLWSGDLLTRTYPNGAITLYREFAGEFPEALILAATPPSYGD
jgi:hypothetical protein